MVSSENISSFIGPLLNLYFVEHMFPPGLFDNTTNTQMSLENKGLFKGYKSKK